MKDKSQKKCKCKVKFLSKKNLSVIPLIVFVIMSSIFMVKPAFSHTDKLAEKKPALISLVVSQMRNERNVQDKISMIVNNKIYNGKNYPYMINGIVYIPLEELASLLVAVVYKNNNSFTVTGKNCKVTGKIETKSVKSYKNNGKNGDIGNNVINENRGNNWNSEKSISLKGKIIKKANLIYVPYDFVELLNTTVDYIPRMRRLLVYDNPYKGRLYYKLMATGLFKEVPPDSVDIGTKFGDFGFAEKMCISTDSKNKLSIYHRRLEGMDTWPKEKYYLSYDIRINIGVYDLYTRQKLKELLKFLFKTEHAEIYKYYMKTIRNEISSIQSTIYNNSYGIDNIYKGNRFLGIYNWSWDNKTFSFIDVGGYGVVLDKTYFGKNEFSNYVWHFNDYKWVTPEIIKKFQLNTD